MSVLLAVSLTDLTVPEGAIAAPVSAPAVPATPLLSSAPTTGQIESTLPLNTPQPLFNNTAPLTNTPPPSSTEVPPGGPTITVTSFDITGNTVYDTATLQALVASSLGKDLTLADLYKVAEVITRYYQDHGYGIARATLPEQTLSGGHVTLQVVEGHVGKLSVEGNTRTRTGSILGQASAVKTGDVYTDSAMDRASLLVNDMPAVQAQAVLSPGSDFGTADVDYKVTEDRLYSGQISVDDYGRPDTGRIRLNGEVNLASPTGIGDHFTADVTHSEHDQLDFGGLTYSLPVGPAGGRLNASYNQSRYHVTGDFSALGLRGTSKNGNLAYQYPEIRSRESSFYWGFGFEHEAGTSSSTITTPVADSKGAGVIDPVTGLKEFKTTTTQLTDSNLNLGQLTAFYTHVYEDGSSYNLSGSFSSNGRHDHGNQPRDQRAKLELDGGYQQPFAQTWTFIAKGASAWSPDPLSDTEKFSLGGPDNIRGYPSADVRGDAGFFGSLELQHSLAPGLPISVGGFFDAGRTWSRHFDTPVKFVNPITGVKTPGFVTTPPEVHTLESVGAELIFQSSDKRWESRLEWAYAVGYAKPSDGNTGGHIWATFGMNF